MAVQIDNFDRRFGFDGWGTKFGTTKCRTTDISECQKYEY